MDTRQFTSGLKVTNDTVENFRQTGLPSMQIGAAKAKNQVEKLITGLTHKKNIPTNISGNIHLYAGAALFMVFGSFIALIMVSKKKD